MFGQRCFVGTGTGAEGDKLYAEFIYDDTTGNLTQGMPVYKSCLDAAEWNNLQSATLLTPAVAASGGKVVLGTNAKVSQFMPVGIFQPLNPAAKPANGDSIRCLVIGVGIVSTVVYNAGTAVLVGDYLVADTTPGVNAASGHNTPVLAQTIGIVLATGAAITKGASIAATGGGTVITLVNAYVSFK